MQDENHFPWRVKLLALGGLAAIAVGAMQIGLTRLSPQAANAQRKRRSQKKKKKEAVTKGVGLSP